MKKIQFIATVFALLSLGAFAQENDLLPRLAKWGGAHAEVAAAFRDRANDAFNAVSDVISEEQAAEIKAKLFPPPTPEAIAAESAAIEARLRALVSSGAITPERLVQKATEIAAETGGN